MNHLKERREISQVFFLYGIKDSLELQIYLYDK